MTSTDADRIIERLRTAWSSIHEAAFYDLATQMLTRMSEWSCGDLRGTTANNMFRQHSGRGQRYHFDHSNLILTSRFPNHALISIEITRIGQ